MTDLEQEQPYYIFPVHPVGLPQLLVGIADKLYSTQGSSPLIVHGLVVQFILFPQFGDDVGQ